MADLLIEQSIWIEGAEVPSLSGVYSGNVGPFHVRIARTSEEISTAPTGLPGSTNLRAGTFRRNLLDKTTLGGALWTPAELGTGVDIWLDSKDMSTLWADGAATTPVSGQVEVRRWDDKSGNGRHFVPMFATGPMSGSSVNGWNALNFGVGNGMIWATTSGWSNNAAAFVAYGPAAATGRRLVRTRGNTANQQGIIADANNLISYRFRTTNYPTETPASPGGVAAHLHNGGGTVTGHMDINGTYWPNIIDDNPSNAFVHNGVLVGANHGTSETEHGGLICEVIAFRDTAISEALRNTIIGYLAHKWGHAALLPAGHAHKSAPPMLAA